MAIYATISHKKNEKHEYVFIFKTREAAIRSARLDIKKFEYVDSKAYMVPGIDAIGYTRSDFSPEMLRKHSEEIASFKEVEQ